MRHEAVFQSRSRSLYIELNLKLSADSREVQRWASGRFQFNTEGRVVEMDIQHAALVSVSIGWIVFYINAVTGTSGAILSAPLVLFSGLSALMFLLLRFFSGGTISSLTNAGTPSGNARCSANAVAP